jgi:hypothetical protein
MNNCGISMCLRIQKLLIYLKLRRFVDIKIQIEFRFWLRAAILNLQGKIFGR